jgi:hypothetical protein
MGRNFSWTAKVGGKTVADGTASGNDSYTADRVQRDAAIRVGVETGAPTRDIKVTVTKQRSNREVVAELRAARKGR